MPIQPTFPLEAQLILSKAEVIKQFGIQNRGMSDEKFEAYIDQERGLHSRVMLLSTWSDVPKEWEFMDEELQAWYTHIAQKGECHERILTKR